MTEQLGIFGPGAPVFPRARKTDAVGSHDAAAAIERCGQARSDAQRILAAVRRWPGCTSMELARNARIERYTVAGRLPELADAERNPDPTVRRVEFSTEANPTGNTVRCAVSGKRAIRWWPS